MVVSSAPKIEIFEILAFLVKNTGLLTKKSEFSNFRVFWSIQQGLATKKSEFSKFGVFWWKTHQLGGPFGPFGPFGPSGPLVQVHLLTHLSLRISWGHFIPKTSNIRLARMKLVQAPAILVGNFGWNQLLDGRTVFRPYTQFRRSICTSESLRTSIRVSPDFILTRHSSPSFGS